MKRILAMLLVSVMLFGCMVVSANAEGVKPGTYTASERGLNGNVTVEVTFSEDAIESVVVTKHIETTGVGGYAAEVMPQRIVDAQSIDVDGITGATLTSSAIKRAVQNCAKQAGFELKSIEKEETEAQEITVDDEVVIIGGGGSGLAAALAASENGAHVTIIEKVDYLGGNTGVSGGIYNCADPEAQAAIEMTDALRGTVEAALAEEPVSDEHAALIELVRADYEEYNKSGSTGLFDSTNWHALQTWNGGDKIANLPLVEFYANQAPDGLNWLKSLGLKITKIAQGGGALWQRTHYTEGPLGSSFINLYKNLLDERADQIDVYYSTTAKSLIQDENGRVTGVYAEDKNGNQYTFNASKGVILATGGFAANVELRQQYCEGDKWPDLGANVKSTNLPGITGDGIIMAQEIGANLVDMDQIQLLHTCSPRTGTTWANYYTSNSLIFINQEGKRFVREDGRRDDMSKAIIAQTGSKMWLVQSGDFIPDPAEAKTADGVPLLEAVEMGDWYMADTLEELAEQIGVPADALVETVAKYNEACEKGVDEEFGRTLLTMPFTKGPYYAYARTPSCHHTMGGVEINTEAQVIDTEGNVIEGLYACGEVTGGIHGGNRLGGNAVADTVIFGRIAGTNAATK